MGRSAQLGRKLSHEQNRLMRTKVRSAPGKTTLIGLKKVSQNYPATVPICQIDRLPRLVERYSHEGYLIKVVVMALAGEVTRELSPILSWSNNNYEI